MSAWVCSISARLAARAPPRCAIALGGHRAAAVEGRAAAGREALPERLLLIAPGVPGGLPLRHQPLERVPDRAPVVGGRERLALGDQRLLALDRRGALARPLGVGAVALLVERLARGGEAPPQLAIAHLAGRWGRLPALEQVAEALGGLGVARRRGQALGLLGDRGAQHLGQRALVLAREPTTCSGISRRGRLLGRRRRPRPRAARAPAPRLAASTAGSLGARACLAAALPAPRSRLLVGGLSATGSSATGSSATGSSTTGSSATGSSATGSSAAGSSATGSSTTGSSAAAAPRQRAPRRDSRRPRRRRCAGRRPPRPPRRRAPRRRSAPRRRPAPRSPAPRLGSVDHGCVRRLLGGRLHAHRRTLDDRSEPLIRARASIGLDLVGHRGARAMHAESTATHVLAGNARPRIGHDEPRERRRGPAGRELGDAHRAQRRARPARRS